jgi:hypothetical protein
MRKSSKHDLLSQIKKAADIFTTNVTEYLFLKHTSSDMNRLADEKHHTDILLEEEEDDEVDDPPIVF